MRYFFYALGVSLALTSVGALCQSEQATDNKEVAGLIQRLYREPEARIVHGQFKGKFNAKMHCALLKEYVQDSLIKQEMLPSGGETCESRFDRFPGYTLQDDMGGFDAPPKHKLVSVRVSGDLAEAVVEMPPEYYPTTEKKYYVARVESYLKRFPQGWRIYAARFYDRYVHPEDLRFLPGKSPGDLYRGSEEGRPPGITLPADRPSK